MGCVEQVDVGIWFVRDRGKSTILRANECPREEGCEKMKKVKAKGFREGMGVEMDYWPKRMGLMSYLERGIEDRFRMGWGLNWAKGYYVRYGGLDCFRVDWVTTFGLLIKYSRD
ncbi:hypothetical protein E5676_scaffold1493G00290 [Cucumis melo var. makuwa]|uniref:Uncharacterized protein n=2 Tax=Cucumis melo TaxID=3656 RepID=A0A5A7UFA6_CUCMM|nr:hypothetical protein E6C27_scaffold1994G00280 [Cucumis melo var. makuwa]TYK19231.1 hypothetical protein E5676_scaffold1493G00290 [Cucumis melo var. makuwa]